MNDKELLNQAIKTLESVRGALGSFAKAEVDLTLGLLRREADEFRCPLCYDDPANIKQPAQQQEPVAREHITDGNPCWCEPETNYKDPETGISVLVHKEPQ